MKIITYRDFKVDEARKCMHLKQHDVALLLTF